MALQTPASLVYTVKRSNPELIVPAKATPYEFKLLSDIDDQRTYRQHARIIQFYPNNATVEDRDPGKVIREAIAETLVYYYPLAGRLKEGANGKLMVECTGEGVLFTVADADVRLEQFGDVPKPPFPGVEDLIYNVPGSNGTVDCPVLLIQVTRLMCGGFILGVRVNHTMCDAVGLAQFIAAVAEIACGADVPSVQPVWKRELLCARDPPQVTCVHHGYRKTRTKLPYDITTEDMVSCSFLFGPQETVTLRDHMPPDLRTCCSKFELLTACLWRCRAIALNLNPEDEVCLAFPVNARAKFNPPIPVGYYGNVLGYPAALSTAGELCQSHLGYAVELVKRAKGDVSEEFMRSTADLMVKLGRPLSTGGNFNVSDLTHFGLADVDFGWGKAVYSGTCGHPLVCTFLSSKNREGEDGILVLIDLPRPTIERFAVEIAKLTKQGR